MLWALLSGREIAEAEKKGGWGGDFSDKDSPRYDLRTMYRAYSSSHTRTPINLSMIGGEQIRVERTLHVATRVR